MLKTKSGTHHLLSALGSLWLSKLKKFPERSFENVTNMQLKDLMDIMANSHVETLINRKFVILQNEGLNGESKEIDFPKL